MLIILKKFCASILVCLIASLIMGTLIYLATLFLNSIVSYPHYEWYMYRLSFINSLTYSLMFCISSYIIYRIILLFFKNRKSITVKIFIYWFSFFIIHIYFVASSGGGGDLSHPITISNIVIYFLMGILIPLIEQIVFKKFKYLNA